MPSNVVVDASVLVSAFLFPRSIPGEVLILANQGLYALCLSPILIEETRRSLMNARLVERYGHSGEEVEQFCNDLMALCFMVNDLPDIGPICRDPNDDHVIAAAVAAKAETIVTGDKDLLSLERHEAIRIIAAKPFVESFMATD